MTVTVTVVSVTDNSPFQDYPHPNDHTTGSYISLLAIPENLVLYQDKIPQLIIFLILITCLLDSVLPL